MSNDQPLLHTPEGVRDIYAEECAAKMAVQDKIQQVFYLYGYQNIETPTFEFFDIFSQERGSVDSCEMFKFFDRDNHTLVLRPDMTPPIARCAAKYFMEEDKPIRLCYQASTFLNSANYQGRPKESTQTGAELIGDDTNDADAEMIAMVIDALKAAGLKDFQVELGQVEFYRGLAEAAGLNQDTQDALRQLIEDKNFFGVEELLSRQSISPEHVSIFQKLPELFGSIDQIRLARTMTDNPRALHAIGRLERVQEILDGYGLGDYVSYDLGMLSKYSYYTGIIFKAYTYGTGDYIVTGGRYDKLLVQFGKDAPAVGFAIVLDRLMAALSRQNICPQLSLVQTAILYDHGARSRATALARHFRSKHIPVQLIRMRSGETLDEYQAFARRRKLRNLLYLSGDGSQIRLFDIPAGTCDTLAYTDYIP